VTSPLGLIAGSGRFPFLVAEQARRQGRRVVAVAVPEETDPALERSVDAFHWVALGQIKKTIALFKEAGAGEAVMAGQIKHARLFQNLKLDLTAMKILATIPDKKTDTLLGAIAREFEKAGIRFMSSIAFLTAFLAPAGALSARRPSANQKRDAVFGLATAKSVAGLDWGQTACVKDGAVLAVEAIEGTDECIRRAGRWGGEGFTVAKVAKPKQDLRFDVPVIGLGTLTALVESKAGAIVVEAGKTLFFDRTEFLAGADAAGIVVLGAGA
jgi:DUF1009 family protein